MLSQTSQYALRTVLHLAGLPAGVRGSAVELAGSMGIPHNYLSKTLHQLARAGVVAGTRGKHGGFVLARPPHRITLVEVVAPFQDVGARSCLLGRPTCSDVRPCPVHAHWKDVAQRVAEFFSGTTVEDLMTAPDGDPVAEALGVEMKKGSRRSHDGLARSR